MKKLLIILTGLFPFSSFAQMALPSVFPEMKTINPAVITMRKSGNIRLSALSDNLTKEQTISLLNGSSFVATENSKISFVDTNFFRGGKGGGFTTEFNADFCTGKKKTTVTNSSGNDNFDTKASSKYASFAMGAGFFGLDFHYVGFDSSYLFKSSFGGQTINFDATQNVTLTGIKPGIVIGGPNISLGITAEYNKMVFKTKMNGVEDDGGGPDEMKIAGVAFAIGGATSLLELGVEVDPLSTQQTDPETQAKLPMPMKISFLAEAKLGFLTLGYKGMAFKGNFIDFDKIVPLQLVYSNPDSKIRLEHIINFSFGGSTGWSFGGSGSYSKADKKEKSSTFGSSELYPTKVTELSASLKASFVY